MKQFPPQTGIALPVMLIMLTVMLISSIYLLKSSTSTTQATANLAYDSALSRAADFGILAGSQWLSDNAVSVTSKQVLTDDVPAHGYVAHYDTSWSASSAGFWQGSVTVADTAGNRIEYVIHRLCTLKGAYDQQLPVVNPCMQTLSNTNGFHNPVALGESLASDSAAMGNLPQLHYVVTARIFGARGGNVVNQAVVMIGA